MIREVFVTVSGTGEITPAGPQYAGVQGEHNMCRVTFDVTAWAEEPFLYRGEFVDGNGGGWTTDLLTPEQENENRYVSYLLPGAWTAAGGRGTARLAASVIENGEETVRAYVIDLPVWFNSKQEADLLPQNDREDGLTALLAEIHGSIDGAAAAAGYAASQGDYAKSKGDAADLAATYANTQGDAAGQAKDDLIAAAARGDFDGADGADGGYYVPSLDASGNLSWAASDPSMPYVGGTNIKGQQGDPGSSGADGGFYVPSVDSSGTLSWTASDPSMPRPEDVNVKGPQGDPGQDAVIDPTLTRQGEAADAKAVGDALAAKVGPDGTVANASQLVSTVFTTDKEPYLFRTSGGSIDIGDRENDTVVGGTIAWNQLVEKANTDKSDTINGITITDNRDGSYSVSGTATADVKYRAIWTSAATTAFDNAPRSGRSYYVCGAPKNASGNTYYLGPQYGNEKDIGNGFITVRGTYTYGSCYIVVKSGTAISTPVVFSPQMYDLTKMFGSVAADYIYSLEQSNEGSGVAWFRKLFPKDFYTYNAGELMSVKTTAHKTVGFNAWDEEWEVGSISGATGENQEANNCIRSANYIRLIPGKPYYFKGSFGNGVMWYDANKQFAGATLNALNNVLTVPEGVHYCRFVLGSEYGTTYKKDICINLSWDGERDGEYAPYEEHVYPLDDSLELRGVSKLDTNNNLYYDGDIYESNGTVTRRYNYLEFDGSSDENWLLQSINSAGIANFEMDAIPTYAGGAYQVNSICNRFIRQITAIANTTTEGYMFAGGTTLYIRIDSTKANTVAAFRTWLASNPTAFVYMYATPTTETADPFTDPQIVDNFGTEEYVDERTVPIPVGHITKYQPNLRAKLEMAPNSPGGDGDYVVRQTNGINEYVPLPKELPAVPAADGAYTLKVTVTGGAATYGWEAVT